jgi:hypothetical protein
MEMQSFGVRDQFADRVRLVSRMKQHHRVGVDCARQVGRTEPRDRLDDGGCAHWQLFDTHYDDYNRPNGGGKGPYPVHRGQNTLIDFTARENPKVKGEKVEEIRDDSIVKELDESGFVKSLGLK